MNKEKGLIAIIVIIVSVVLTIFIAMWLLDTTGKVNQGNYRISDIIIQSGATVNEVQDNSVKIEKLSGLFFDVSQTNEITIFIEANTKIASMMLDNIKISDPVLKGQMSLAQKDYEKYEITQDLKSLPLYLEEKDGQYKICLVINNDKVITDKNVSDDKESIPYSGEIFKLWDIPASDLAFDISFDLYITDETGTKVKTTINLKMPAEEMLESGMSILKQDASKYLFTIQK